MYRRIKDQKGLVTIVSIMIIIIIITVITLSLAALSRRELRQSLDEQLSSQALYAAESGVNDAIKILDPFKADRLKDNISSCDDSNQNKINTNRVLGDNVRYTCVLIDQTPDSIVTDIKTNEVKTYLLDDPNGKISTINIDWTNTTDTGELNISDCNPGSGCLTPYQNWGERLGLLRLRLLPFEGSSNILDRNKKYDITAFPFPITGSYSSSADLNASGGDYLLKGNCSTTNKKCSVVINGINANQKYYIQAYSYYKDLKMTITGQTVTTGGATVVSRFSGAQAKIDATGAAGDVLKRVEVRAPLGSLNTENMPVFGLGVGDKLCKRFTTNESGTSDSSDVLTSCPAF